MSRYLVVGPPFPSHLMALAAVGGGLLDRGHRVAWVAHPETAGSHLPEGAPQFPAPLAPSGSSLDLDRYRDARGLPGYRALVEDVLVPLARGMVPATEEAIRRFEPDLVVADRLAWTGGLAARRLGARWATATACAGTRYLALAELPAALPWTDGKLVSLQEEYGLAPADEPELSGLLDLVFASPALVGEPEDAASSVRFVGPVVAGREPETTPFPWEELGPGPTLLVSLGTVERGRGERFYAAATEALSDFEGTVVMTAPEEMGPFPDTFVVRSWVPQVRLLREIDAVVTHAGLNTVQEALLARVPMVVAPITNDQPYIAGKVVEAGAGVRVSFTRARSGEIRRAVEAVLSEERYRREARTLGEQLAEEDGLARAVGLLESAADDG